jgi:hypothetical protein
MITKLLGNPSAKLIGEIENEKNKEFVLALPKREKVRTLTNYSRVLIH